MTLRNKKHANYPWRTNCQVCARVDLQDNCSVQCLSGDDMWLMNDELIDWLNQVLWPFHTNWQWYRAKIETGDRDTMPYSFQLILRGLLVARTTESQITNHFSFVTVPPTGLALGVEFTNFHVPAKWQTHPATRAQLNEWWRNGLKCK